MAQYGIVCPYCGHVCDATIQRDPATDEWIVRCPTCGAEGRYPTTAGTEGAGSVRSGIGDG